MSNGKAILGGTGLVIGCVAAVALYAALRPVPTAPPQVSSAVEDQAPPLPVARKAPPLPGVVTVEAEYPGASAQVVADTVAAPIEQQLQGLEQMLYMRSRCGNDGSYRLTIALEPGADLNEAQKLVLHRVNLAEPALPHLVTLRGVTIKKKSQAVLLIATLTAPEGRYDAHYLSNYAKVQIEEELGRVPGVAEVVRVGDYTDQVRILVDPAKLAKLNLTVADVARTLQDQNSQVPAGRVGQPPVPSGKSFNYTVTNLGRLTDVRQYEDIVIKTEQDSGRVRLKDVATLHVMNDPRSEARVNGLPAAALVVFPLPQADLEKVSAAVKTALDRARARLPEGLRLDVRFDFTSNLTASPETVDFEYLLFDPVLPDSASEERRRLFLERCEKLLRKMDGVADVLTLTEQPFELVHDRACMMVRLATRRDEVIAAIRKQFDEVPDGILRLRDPAGIGQFKVNNTVELTLLGPDAARVEEWARLVVRRLGENKKFTAVTTSTKASPHFYIDVDRAELQKRGISLKDAYNTLSAHFGSVYVDDFNRFGRNWQVIVQADPTFRKDIHDIASLKVRDRQGNMISLETFVKEVSTTGPAIVNRYNMYPSAEITGATAPGTSSGDAIRIMNALANVSQSEARAMCEKVIEATRRELKLPEEYKLRWLDESSR